MGLVLLLVLGCFELTRNRQCLLRLGKGFRAETLFQVVIDIAYICSFVNLLAIIITIGLEFKSFLKNIYIIDLKKT